MNLFRSIMNKRKISRLYTFMNCCEKYTWVHYSLLSISLFSLCMLLLSYFSFMFVRMYGWRSSAYTYGKPPSCQHLTFTERAVKYVIWLVLSVARCVHQTVKKGQDYKDNIVKTNISKGGMHSCQIPKLMLHSTRSMTIQAVTFFS